MKKRILSVILVILLCLNLIPFNVVAAEEKAPASLREAVSAEEGWNVSLGDSTQGGDLEAGAFEDP